MARDFVQSNVTPLRVIANPRAGHGRGAERAERLAAALRAAGMSFELCRTEHPGQATALAAAATGPVVAVGGDGTVHEVLNGLVPRDGRLGPLAILPAGSGDDFAAAVGAPDTVAALVELLRSGSRREVDTGVAEFAGENGTQSRRFANNAGLGFEAEVVAAAAAARRLRGRALYLAATLRALRHQRPVDCEVSCSSDGTTATTWQGPLLFASVCNGHRVGGGLPFAPSARIDDGILDLLQVTSTSRRATLQLLWRLLRARHERDPRVRVTRCTRLEVRAATPMPLAMDGELVARSVQRLAVTIATERLLVIAEAAASGILPTG